MSTFSDQLNQRLNHRIEQHQIRTKRLTAFAEAYMEIVRQREDAEEADIVFESPEIHDDRVVYPVRIPLANGADLVGTLTAKATEATQPTPSRHGTPALCKLWLQVESASREAQIRLGEDLQKAKNEMHSQAMSEEPLREQLLKSIDRRWWALARATDDD